jgi:Zn-dependent peptidase ImmA (M78 family)
MHDIQGEHAEQEAHEFAAELLTPKREIKPMLLPINLDRLARLKLHWGVSMQAILKRAHDLRVVTDRQARYHWMLMSRAGYRSEEPYDDKIAKEKPRLVRQLVELHLSELGYSKAALSERVAAFEDEFDATYGLEPTLRVVK